MLPQINKLVLKNAGVIKNFKDKGVEIVRVSKGDLSENAAKMEKAIRKRGKELGLEREFNEILKKFPDKEKLRETLINAHKNIFKLDFLTTSVAITSLPWLVNLYTELTTGRKGYSGEFEMADEAYTDKQAKGHEENKDKKLLLSFGLAIAPALIIPGYVARAMKQGSEQLGRLSGWIKKNAKNFDYKDGKFMSLLTYAVMWHTGDLPSYLLAARDKHELKYNAVAFPVLGAFFFAGDRILNSVFGRFLDKHKGTSIMNTKGYEKAGFWKKLFMPMKSLKDITSAKSLKYAQGMYWGNMALTALLIGTIMPRILNRVLKKNVEAELEQENTTRKEVLRDLFSVKSDNSYIDMEEALRVIHQQ